MECAIKELAECGVILQLTKSRDDYLPGEPRKTKTVQTPQDQQVNASTTLGHGLPLTGTQITRQT